MLLQRIKRKLYKAFHPVVGEIWMLHRCVSREQCQACLSNAEVQQRERSYRVVEQRSEKQEQRELEVTPEWLEHKILEYRQKGYTFISINDIPSLNTKRFVCVTLDDGYRDNYTLAYPMLKRLGVPFTVYVTTGFIDNRLPMWWYPEEKLGISTEELKALDADPLCTIGAHTVSHPKLDTLSYEEQYKEIADSKQALERLLGHPVQHFSFPHGAHNADTLAICRELGFQTVAQSWGGAIRKGQLPYPLPRIEMTQP